MIRRPFAFVDTLFKSSRYIRHLQHSLKLQASSCRCYTNKNILRLHDRGLFEDIFPDWSPKLKSILSSKQCFYSGFDPTASSLHVGNLLVLFALLNCQRSGHQVITVIGDGTAQIGDPSGHSTDRKTLTRDEINENTKSIKNSIEKIFENHHKYFWKEDEESPLLPLLILQNDDWYKDQNIVDFLSNVGRRLRLGQMLSRKSVQSRTSSEHGMSFCEFSYQLFQAYDWLHLNKNYDCKFQIGGSDQMGNIHSGYELVNKVTNDTVYGLTVPLIKSKTGNKLGKSAQNAVWLCEDQTSAFDFYQFFMRLSDFEAEKILPLFTFQPLADIQTMISKHKENPEKRKIQKKLANDLTLLVHAEEGLDLAKKSTAVLYDQKPESLVNLSQDDFRKIFKGNSYLELLLEPGVTIIEAAMLAGCFANIDDAQRIIAAGGLYINHVRVTEPENALVHGIHILPNFITLIRIGKKNYYIVQWLK